MGNIPRHRGQRDLNKAGLEVRSEGAGLIAFVLQSIICMRSELTVSPSEQSTASVSIDLLRRAREKGLRHTRKE